MRLDVVAMLRMPAPRQSVSAGLDFCHHSQGFILATLQLLNVGRCGPRLLRQSGACKEAKLQIFVDFQLALFHPHSFEVREASTRHLAVDFVEILWMCEPKHELVEIVGQSPNCVKYLA